MRRSGVNFSKQDILYILFSLLCVLLINLSIKFPSLNQMFQQGIVAVGLPIIQVSQAPVKLSQDLSDWVEGVTDIHDTNKQLQERVHQLEDEINNLKRVRFENERLSNLLDVVKSLKGDPITTHVLLDPSSPFRRTVLVAVGRQDGVEKGQEVISSYGLVGRIVEVFDQASRVLLISDYISRVPVKILETRERAILTGTNENEKLKLLFTEQGKFIRPHMTVVTSGDGLVFSEGLPVGTVDTVGSEIMVRPDVDLSRIDKVSILRRPVAGVLKASDLEISEGEE